jgi:deazaflavin-dependent oxidoreductase (nitroreductase family)
MKRPPQLDSPVVPRVMRVMSRLQVGLYRATGGLLGSKWRVGSAFPWGIPICLLTTTGRKTGQPRTTPLLYIEDGSNVIVVASQGGLPWHPLWFNNLLEKPAVEVQIGRRVRRMRARAANLDERRVLWPRLVAHYSDFANYQSWTEREIPVVICEPA